MTIVNRSMDHSSGFEYVKKYAKQMLKGTIFTGVFQEKRLVEDLGAYRDIVTVCADEENFIQNLKIVKNKIDKEVLIKTWLGITEPDVIGAPVGFNLWVDLPQEVFGKYWYKVKTVEFLNREIRLKLEILRPYQRESTPVRNTSANECESVSAILEEKKLQVKEYFAYFLKEMVTLNNLVETLKFIAILFTTILAGLFNVLQYLLEWLLKFIRELSGFIKATTPILIHITNLVGNTIFGLFKLIYALFQDKPKPTPVYNNFINFDPQTQGFVDPHMRYNNYFNKPLPYFPPIQQRSPRITPLN